MPRVLVRASATGAALLIFLILVFGLLPSARAGTPATGRAAGTVAQPIRAGAPVLPPAPTPTGAGKSDDAPRHGSTTPPSQRIHRTGTSSLSQWRQDLVDGLLTLLGLALFAVAVTTLSWMLHAWRSPGHLSRTRFRIDGSPRPTDLAVVTTTSFTLLVPARHEQAVLGDTLDTLAAATHPDVEILAIVGDDDPGTHEVAAAAARRHPDRVRVIVDSSVPKNKPKALNTALAHARNEIVGVFDAEDDVHPDLLRHVDARFAATGADVVQGGVQLMNVHTTWWSLRNCLEYYFWFRSRLHFHADQEFIPLGGNTVFIRRQLLLDNDGWDPDCLAEDCEIGVRLSSRGASVAVAYEAEVVTREETPDSVRALVKQRTRWNQGFLQVLRKGVWRSLPGRRQRLLARYTLSMPFLQALTGLLVPVSVALILFVTVPTPIVLITLLPIAPTVLTVAMEMAAYGEFCSLYGVQRRIRDYVYLILGAIPYQLILAYSAARAVVRQIRGEGGWEKTSHANLHREAAAAPELVTTGEAA